MGDTRFRLFVAIVVAVVAVGTIGGFLVVGSPVAERARRFDNLRVQHLQMIQGELVNYWQAKDKLPAQLSDLNSDVKGFALPLDPATRSPYDYKITSSTGFIICANFAAPADSAGPLPYARPIAPAGAYGPVLGGENWQHGAGQVCFSRTIDPDFFKHSPNWGME